MWFVLFCLRLSSAAKPNSVVLADFQNLLNYLLCSLNSVCNIFWYTTLLYKKWCNIVISGPAFVWTMFALSILEVMWFLSGFYPRDCRDEPSEVRVKPHLPLRWWLAHLNWFWRAVLPHSPDHQPQGSPRRRRINSPAVPRIFKRWYLFPFEASERKSDPHVTLTQASPVLIPDFVGNNLVPTCIGESVELDVIPNSEYF